MAIKQIPVVSKPVVSKPVAPKPVVSVSKPVVVPAIVQQAGPVLSTDKKMAELEKKLAMMEKELAAEKSSNVALQEKIAKKEDKNAWRERIYTLQDVEGFALGNGDSPIAGDWREAYNETFQTMMTYSIDKDGTAIRRDDLPPRMCLCVVPSSGMPVEPGDSPQFHRANRTSGYMAFWDDFFWENGEIKGVRGTPHSVQGDVFVSLLLEAEQAEQPEPEAVAAPAQAEPEAVAAPAQAEPEATKKLVKKMK